MQDPEQTTNDQMPVSEELSAEIPILPPPVDSDLID
jgi:hypothetical protein